MCHNQMMFGVDSHLNIVADDTGAAAGILVGTQWAIQRASLKEAQQIADLTSREWNTLRLEQNHSLVVKLVDEGVLQTSHDGPIDLARDGFTEGLIIGRIASGGERFAGS
jgi:hypothetical protein